MMMMVSSIVHNHTLLLLAPDMSLLVNCGGQDLEDYSRSKQFFQKASIE